MSLSYYDVHDNAGGTTFTKASPSVVTLDTVRVDEPSGSSPFSLSSGEVTIAETGDFLFVYRMAGAYSSGVPNQDTSLVAKLSVDTGGGFANIDGSEAHAGIGSDQTGMPWTATGHALYSVTSGDVFRVGAAAGGTSTGGTYATVVDASGLTIVRMNAGYSDNKVMGSMIAMLAVVGQAVGGDQMAYVFAGLGEYLDSITEATFTGAPVTDAATVLGTFIASDNYGTEGVDGATKLLESAKRMIEVYDADGGPVS